MTIELMGVASLLKQRERILLLCHQSPDGDTLGSAAGLCLALQRLGKQARIECSDPFPRKYDYMLSPVKREDFAPDLIMAVDVADEKLLGEKVVSLYGGKVELCVDHHASQRQFAPLVYVDKNAAATAEIIFELVELLGVSMDKEIANCLFTGLSTDTGCFRYGNTTPHTHLVAAQLMESGAQAADINTRMFETKTRARIELERMVLSNLEFYENGQCALISITREMLARSGAEENDLEGIAPIPRKIEGVKIGLTLREKENGDYKISVRTAPEMDASELCKRLGGGGHRQAAGCTVEGGLDRAKHTVVGLAREMLRGR